MTSLVGDFLARTSALLEREWVSREAARGCGARCLGLWGRLDPATSSLRTLQPSLFGDSSGSYATFPKSGMMLNGNVFRTAPLASPTEGKGYTLLPTPTKSDSNHAVSSMEVLRRYLSRGHQSATVTTLLRAGFSRLEIASIIEAMMGFPAGHTELGRWATR